MEIKRYDFDRAHCTGASEFGCPSSMEECACGDYVRWEDLIAAGVLVPVPDGEACMACESGTHGIITIPDRAGVFRRTGYGGGKNGSYVIFSDAAEDGEVRVPVETRVRPVRLLPLEDVG